MRIFLNDTKSLPSASVPSNPEVEFSFELGRMLVRDLDGNVGRFQDCAVWPVLHGLCLVDAPLLAHVTALRFHEYRLHLPERFEFEITTCPAEVNRGIPVIVRDGRLVVEKVLTGRMRTKNNPQDAWISPQTTRSSWKYRDTFEAQLSDYLQKA